MHLAKENKKNFGGKELKSWTTQRNAIELLKNQVWKRRIS